MSNNTNILLFAASLSNSASRDEQTNFLYPRSRFSNAKKIFRSLSHSSQPFLALSLTGNENGKWKLKCSQVFLFHFRRKSPRFDVDTSLIRKTKLSHEIVSPDRASAKGSVKRTASLCCDCDFLVRSIYVEEIFSLFCSRSRYCDDIENRSVTRAIKDSAEKIFFRVLEISLVANCKININSRQTTYLFLQKSSKLSSLSGATADHLRGKNNNGQELYIDNDDDDFEGSGTRSEVS